VDIFVPGTFYFCLPQISLLIITLRKVARGVSPQANDADTLLPLHGRRGRGFPRQMPLCVYVWVGNSLAVRGLGEGVRSWALPKWSNFRLCPSGATPVSAQVERLASTHQTLFGGRLASRLKLSATLWLNY